MRAVWFPKHEEVSFSAIEHLGSANQANVVYFSPEKYQELLLYMAYWQVVGRQSFDYDTVQINCSWGLITARLDRTLVVFEQQLEEILHEGLYVRGKLADGSQERG